MSIKFGYVVNVFVKAEQIFYIILDVSKIYISVLLISVKEIFKRECGMGITLI